MTPKIFEVRDRATFMPVMAVRLQPSTEAEMHLLTRAGYGLDGMDPLAIEPYVILIKLDDVEAHYDSFLWSSRTLRVIHQHLVSHWDSLKTGSVLDVEYLLGETTKPKPSEFIP